MLVRRVPGIVCLRSIVLAAATAMTTMGAGADETSAPIGLPIGEGAPWNAAGIAKLHGDLDGLLEGATSLKGAHVGVIAVDTRTGVVLYERHADEEFQPASTLKLVVGSAALDLLGPAFRTTTTARLAGDTLYVVPAGDPFFGTADADDLAGAVLARTKHVARIVVDVGGFAPADHPNGWTFDDFAEDYAPAISRATFEENVVHLHVSPAADGTHANVAATPALAIFAPPATACSESAYLVDDATVASAGSENTLDVEPRANGCRVLVGSIARDAAASDIDVAVPDPPHYLAQSIAYALRKRGVAVDGSADAGPAPLPFASNAPPAPDWSRASKPLADILAPFWIPSDNFVGETLLMHLGGERDATRERALEAERTWLRTIGVDPATTSLADGSGLSQYDRITPRDLVTILQHDWNAANRQLVLDSLPIGGSRGTIEGIAGTPASGRVFAKTGSMMHVRGLAGYLQTRRHGAVTFAFNVDDWIGDYKDLAATRAAVLVRLIRD